MIAAAFLLLQAAAGTPQSFSILADPCPQSSETEVVVCGRSPDRLPLPDAREPVDNRGSPCTGSFSGCWVGVDVISSAMAVARLAGDAARRLKKTDRTGRVAIDLDAPPPGPAGRVGP